MDNTTVTGCNVLKTHFTNQELADGVIWVRGSFWVRSHIHGVESQAMSFGPLLSRRGRLFAMAWLCCVSHGGHHSVTTELNF